MPERSNCILAAVLEWRRLQRQWLAAGRPVGGEPYLWTRSSRLAPLWLPHAGVAQWVGDRLVMRSYRPIDRAPLRWWQSCRALWFAGQWVEGDA